MTAPTRVRAAAHVAAKLGAAGASVLAVLAFDLAVHSSYWPALFYVVVVFAVIWVRSTSLLIATAALSVVGLAVGGLINAPMALAGTHGEQIAGRTAIGILIAVIVVVRLVRGRGPTTSRVHSGPTSGAIEVARQVSDSAVSHAVESAALAGVDAATREAFKAAANDYATHLEQRMERLLEVMPVVVWSANAQGAIDYVNDVFASFAGLPTSQLVGDGWMGLIHPDDLELAVSKWQEAMTTRQPYATEFRLRAADGEYRWLQHNAMPERDDDGNAVRWWGTSVDVHEMRMLGAEARNTAEELEHVLQSVGDGVSEIDKDWVLTFVSDRSASLVGSTPDELVGKNIWELYPEMAGSVMETTYREAVATGEPRDFTTFNPVLGKWFAVNATPTDRGLTVAFRDVTETRRLQENLERAQRLESIGRLTGGVAHDFNNLLTVVLGGAEALGENESLTGEDRELLDLILEAARQGAELTTTMLAFARQLPLEPRPTDLDSLVKKIAPLVRHALGEGIELAVKQAGALPAASVDPSRFESAVLNLAINASDAMPEGGRLSIETRRADVDAEYAERAPGLKAGTYVITSVSDTGTGISAEHLPHLFDPFFTTKPAGRGSGLGLAMVWGFAQQSGGHVSVYSEEGVGTTFNLFLPATDAAPLDLPDDDAAQDVSGSGTILMADDDDLVREFASAQLRSRGYDVIEAASGRAALELLDSMESVDLLFTDVVMPGGMNGRDLARAVTERRPGVPVLFASGYTEDVVLNDAAIGPNAAVLLKPYTARQLAGAVARAMAAGKAAS